MTELYAQLTERRDLNATQIQALRNSKKLVPGMQYLAKGTGSRYFAESIDKLELIKKPDDLFSSMIDANWFEVPQGSPKSAYPPGWQYLNGGVSENAIVKTALPDSSEGLAWHCIPSGNSGADGGFNYGGGKQPVDPSKLYRVCSWFRRNVNARGTSYHGLHNFNEAGANIGVITAAGGEDSNPLTNFYFFHADLPSLDEWYLVVSYVHPEHTRNVPRLGGIYRYGDISKQANITRDGRFVKGTTMMTVRNYLYYTTEPDGCSQHIFQPRIDLVDGNEPSLSDLLGVKGGRLIKQYDDEDLVDGWENYHVDYPKLTATLCEGMVNVTGMVKANKGGEIARLPEAMRPEKRHVFQHNKGRFDVSDAGQIFNMTTDEKDWLSINCTYPSKWMLSGENR